MIKIVNIDDLRVIKNISEEEYICNFYEIDKTVNILLLEMLDENDMIDIDDRTIIKVFRDKNELVVSIEDIFRRYHKEQRFEV